MLLAVLVVHGCRSWLSVTGTSAELTLALEMDPRACNGWTTVRPLWLFGDSGAGLQTGTVEFFHLELIHVDTVEAAYVEHYHVSAARTLAVGV